MCVTEKNSVLDAAKAEVFAVQLLTILTMVRCV